MDTRPPQSRARQPPRWWTPPLERSAGSGADEALRPAGLGQPRPVAGPAGRLRLAGRPGLPLPLVHPAVPAVRDHLHHLQLPLARKPARHPVPHRLAEPGGVLRHGGHGLPGRGVRPPQPPEPPRLHPDHRGGPGDAAPAPAAVEGLDRVLRPLFRADIPGGHGAARPGPADPHGPAGGGRGGMARPVLGCAGGPAALAGPHRPVPGAGQLAAGAAVRPAPLLRRGPGLAVRGHPARRDGRQRHRPSPQLPLPAPEPGALLPVHEHGEPHRAPRVPQRAVPRPAPAAPPDGPVHAPALPGLVGRLEGDPAGAAGPAPGPGLTSSGGRCRAEAAFRGASRRRAPPGSGRRSPPAAGC